MIGHTHSLAEWLAMTSLATGTYATCSIPVLLYSTTWRRDLHQAAVHAGHNFAWAAASASQELAPAAVVVRCAAYSAREVARDAVALALLLATRPNGAIR